MRLERISDWTWLHIILLHLYKVAYFWIRCHKFSLFFGSRMITVSILQSLSHVYEICHINFLILFNRITVQYPQRCLKHCYLFYLGSAWTMLSRPFMEYLLWGWDNLPRIVLMYYANFLSTPEGYFHTVICNAEEFWNTTVNHDLHFISWDNPPKQHPHVLTLNDYQNMVDSNAAFARKFRWNEPVLDKIDSELLGRKVDGFVPGSWFDGADANGTISLYTLRNITSLSPGPGAQRIKSLVSGLLSDKDFNTKHCR